MEGRRQATVCGYALSPTLAHGLWCITVCVTDRKPRLGAQERSDQCREQTTAQNGNKKKDVILKNSNSKIKVKRERDSKRKQVLLGS